MNKHNNAPLWPLVSLELWSIAYFVVASTYEHPQFANFTFANHLIEGRARLVLVPLSVAALGTAGWLVWNHYAPTHLREHRRSLVRGLAPLSIAWSLPGLMHRNGFEEHALEFVCLLTGLSVAVELTIGFALPTWQRARPLHSMAVPAAAWHGIVGSCTAAFAAFAAWGSVRIHHKMLTSIFDLGLFENLFFNTLTGRHGIAVEIPYFGQHAEPLLYLVAPLYWLMPGTETLLCLQAVLIAGGAIPIYLMARTTMDDGWRPTVLATSYLLYPAIHGPLFFDFHFLAISGFFLLWAGYFLLKGTRSGFWLFLILAMGCREDVALGVSAVAIGGLIAGWPQKRLAIAVAIVSGLWFGFIRFYWMQQFISNAFAPYYSDLLPEGKSGFSGVATTIISNPIYALKTLLRADKLLLLLQLLAPLAFLPARNIKFLPLFLPGFLVVGLATSHGALLQIHFHYVTHFVPYLFAGACVAAGTLGRAKQSALMVTILLVSVVNSHQFGALFVDEFQTSFHKISFDWTETDQAQRSSFLRMSAHIPDNATLAAGEHEGPHLAARPHMVSLKYGLRDYDYAITSKRSLRWGGRKHLRKALRSGAYGVVGVDEHFLLVKQGADNDKNAEGLRFLAK